jgi:hypothetical protein
MWINSFCSMVLAHVDSLEINALGHVGEVSMLCPSGHVHCDLQS